MPAGWRDRLTTAIGSALSVHCPLGVYRTQGPVTHNASMLGVALFCLIVAIVDGNSLTARCPIGDAVHPYQQVKVHLAEIDAPARGQPFGRRSRQHLSDLCFKVEASIQPTATDRLGCTVARVECRGQDASMAQVRAGMAWAFTKYQTDPAFPVAEQRARAAGVGMWTHPNNTPPWQFRRQAATVVPDEYGCYTGPRGGRYRLLSDGSKCYNCTSGTLAPNAER